jgi:DNA-binding NtrC family response regulator
MARGSNDLRRPRVWQALQSLLAGGFSRSTPASRIPIVVLAAGEQDRTILANVATHQPFQFHFAQSCEDASNLARQLRARVILFDRNWPGTDWRTAVESLATAPHATCVILMSGVADDYLWQELIRRGGYDVLAKPIRADNVERVIKLALSYLNSARKPAVQGLRRVAD